MLNKTLRGYYKRMLYQNRGPVARGLDFLALDVYKRQPLLHETTVESNSQDAPSANPYYVEGTQGIKTGFIDEAGYCLVAAATQEERTLIAVVLGAKTIGLRNQSAAALLRYGFEHTSLVEIRDTLAAVSYTHLDVYKRQG